MGRLCLLVVLSFLAHGSGSSQTSTEGAAGMFLPLPVGRLGLSGAHTHVVTSPRQYLSPVPQAGDPRTGEPGPAGADRKMHLSRPQKSVGQRSTWGGVFQPCYVLTVRLRQVTELLWACDLPGGESESQAGPHGAWGFTD